MSLPEATLYAVHESVCRVKNDVSANELTDDSDLIALGFRSIDIMNLIFELENRFHIVFSDKSLQLENFITPKAIVSTLAQYVTATL